MKQENLRHTGQAMTEALLAWAVDRTTGRPRYIMELEEHERGQNCGCICPGCGTPLVAINAAKTTYKKRPHFRHEAGTERYECLVSAARAALLAMMEQPFVLELPRRRRSATAIGASGTIYEAWAESDIELVNVTAARLLDRATALLELDDGRQLLVELVGQFDPGEPGGVAKLQILVDDPQIASLPHDELLPRLRLLGKHGVWCKHWRDELLDDESQLAAGSLATNNLDGQLPDYVDVNGLTSSQRHETYLRFLTKEIIQSAKRIKVPSLFVSQSRQLHSGKTIKRDACLNQATLLLSDVYLERSVGSGRPDIVAVHDAVGEWAGGQLHIEVSVTHGINAAKASRIRELGVPTLEINLGKMGGKLTHPEFVKLVVDDVVGKHWVYHPAQNSLRQRLEAELDAAEVALGRGQATQPYVDPYTSGCQFFDAALPSHDAVEVAKAAELVEARNGWLTGRALAEWHRKHGKPK